MPRHVSHGQQNVLSRRRVSRDSETRKSLQSGVRTAFRLPARLLHSERKKPASPALQYLSALPRRYAARALPRCQQAPVWFIKHRVSLGFTARRTSLASAVHPHILRCKSVLHPGCSRGRSKICQSLLCRRSSLKRRDFTVDCGRPSRALRSSSGSRRAWLRGGCVS